MDGTRLTQSKLTESWNAVHYALSIHPRCVCVCVPVLSSVCVPALSCVCVCAPVLSSVCVYVFFLVCVQVLACMTPEWIAEHIGECLLRFPLWDSISLDLPWFLLFFFLFWVCFGVCVCDRISLCSLIGLNLNLGPPASALQVLAFKAMSWPMTFCGLSNLYIPSSPGSAGVMDACVQLSVDCQPTNPFLCTWVSCPVKCLR